MTDTNEGTAPEGGEAQAETETSTTGTPAPKDEVTTLRSRNAGLDAKVTSLMTQAEAAEAARKAAEQKLADYEAGKVQGDEALRAQLSTKETELAEARREAALAKIEAKFPETFAVLGDSAATLTPEKLAEAEARFKGIAAEAENPKPIGNNPSRVQGGASGASNKAEITVKDREAHLATLTPPWLAND